jgi:uncharacterized protein (DUF2236 family)
MSGLALAPAGANVVMQLSRLEVGRGVAESRVQSGALTAHPIKRTRTTLGYLVVSLLGDEDMRAYLRKEVNRSHRDVHSREGDDVAYDAFDADLQVWVAACMYQGAREAVALMGGPLSESDADELYRHCARFATTLQVTPSQWPPDRDAFEEYWRGAVSRIAMDDVTRSYLRRFVRLSFLPRALSVWLGPLHEFLTAGFLPPVFREELGLSWSPRRQRVFGILSGCSVRIHRALPRVLGEFPLNLAWWDAQRRYRSGRNLV